MTAGPASPPSPGADPGSSREAGLAPILSVEQMALEFGQDYAYQSTRTSIVNGKKRTERFWVVTDKGHALLGARMRAHAERARANGSADWVQPPSSGRERTHE